MKFDMKYKDANTIIDLSVFATLIISNKPGSFQNMFNIPQSNQSLESTQTPQLTGNFISLVHKMYKAPHLIEGPPSETNKSIKSLEEFTPETILSIIEVLRKKIIKELTLFFGQFLNLDFYPGYSI